MSDSLPLPSGSRCSLRIKRSDWWRSKRLGSVRVRQSKFSGGRTRGSVRFLTIATCFLAATICVLLACSDNNCAEYAPCLLLVGVSGRRDFRDCSMLPKRRLEFNVAWRCASKRAPLVSRDEHRSLSKSRPCHFRSTDITYEIGRVHCAPPSAHTGRWPTHRSLTCRAFSCHDTKHATSIIKFQISHAELFYRVTECSICLEVPHRRQGYVMLP
jgi:hypothetical protein